MEEETEDEPGNIEDASGSIEDASGNIEDEPGFTEEEDDTCGREEEDDESLSHQHPVNSEQDRAAQMASTANFL
ncbi:MAG: hypothetical protein RSD78_09285, partial [Oscillospiraceae bacterium]